MKTQIHILSVALVLLTGLHQAKADTLFVANANSNSIVKIAANGAATVFTTNGLASPYGVAFDSAGNLFVANLTSANASSITKIAPDGTASLFYNTTNNGPIGLAIDASNNVYAAYSHNNLVEKFSPGGQDLGVFASSISYCYGLAFDGAGNLYAAAANGNVVKKFSPAGSLLLTLTATISIPTGVAVDSSNNVYVACASGNYIKKFSSIGTDLGIFANTGMSNPNGLAFDSAGNLYVANAVNPGFIRKYSPGGTDLGSFASTGLNTPTFLAFQKTSVSLTNILVTPANQTIGLGSNLQFTATEQFNDGSSLVVTNGGTNSFWSNSNPSVATITTNGTATSLMRGVTTITATLGGVNGSATLTVSNGATTWYVWTNSPSNGPGLSWATAYHDIQSAINVTASGDTVLVTNGYYATGGVGSVYSSRVTITNAIMLKSVNGPVVTTIAGDNNSIRCVYLGATNAVLSGFIITMGFDNSYGAGIYAANSSIITNCFINNNTGSALGGGVYGGVLYNCTLQQNDASGGGGGAYVSILNNCIITDNRASFDGGGVLSCQLTNCLLARNTAYKVGGGGNVSSGGGANGGSLTGCTIISNVAYASNGGGTHGSTLNNCFVIGNRAGDSGGGVSGGSLFNCTVVSNSANSAGGGGIFRAMATNSVIYNNTASSYANYDTNSTLSYSCAAPLAPGVGNISSDPQFTNAASGDFHLLATSPCIDAGNNAAVIGTTDLDGNPRIIGSAVDMGAYEYQSIVVAPNIPFTYTTNNGAITITGYNTTNGGLNVVIPTSINGYPVTTIGVGAFNNLTTITNVTIPNSVTNIGIGPFRSCYSLTSISVNAANPSYASAGGVLFDKTLATLIQYPEGLVGSYVIPNGVTSIGNYAFDSCGLTSVTIPNNVTNIGNYAFSSCFGLTNVTIPNGVISIGNFAFGNCVHLKSAYFQGNAPTDNGSAFWGEIGTAYYLASTTGWGSTFGGWPTVALQPTNAFTFTTNSGAITITGYNTTNGGLNVVIPASINGYPVTTIGVGAFQNLTTITNVTIPNSVTNIGIVAFANCSGLTSVTIPSSVTSIGQQAFYNCSGLTSVTIASGVISIGDLAFAGCSGLTSVTIPNSVTSIGVQVFFNCPSLTSISVNVANPNYASAGGVLFDKTLATLIQYPGGLTGGYTIPNSVTNIGNNAFNNCSGLTNVTIPNSVTSMGGGAFINCSGLKSVTIPNSVTSMGSYVFASCLSLTNAYFQGNAPLVNGGAGSADSTVFQADTGTAYYLAGKTGWNSTFGGWPTATYSLPSSPPALGMSTYSGQPAVFFPTATGTNYVLQMTTNLNTGPWVTVSNGVSISGIVVTNALPAAFFRLH